MKLALITDAIYPYHKGGKETRTHELSTRLVRAGFDVTVYTMKWWDGPELERVEDGVRLVAISRKWPLYAGERRSIVQGVMFGLAGFKLLWADFDVADVDHMPYFPLFSMRIVCSLRRKPMIATWHEVWGAKYWKQYLGWAGLLAAGLEWLTVQLPDAIVAVSEQTAADLVGKLGARKPLSVAANGIDAAAIASVQPATEASDIVFVGRLLAHKRVNDLVRAVALIKTERPEVRCVIISDGPERAKLEALARELGVAKNVKFKGFIESDAEKLALMKASRVFVLPSVREGFSFVTLEALACGLPVVTTDHPGNAARHLVSGANGRLVTAGDVVAMAEAIREVLDGQVAADATVAASHDWQNAAQTLAEVYAS